VRAGGRGRQPFLPSFNATLSTYDPPASFVWHCPSSLWRCSFLFREVRQRQSRIAQPFSSVHGTEADQIDYSANRSNSEKVSRDSRCLGSTPRVRSTSRSPKASRLAAARHQAPVFSQPEAEGSRRVDRYVLLPATPFASRQHQPTAYASAITTISAAIALFSCRFDTPKHAVFPYRYRYRYPAV
jgi:hypothetical protein